MKHAQLIDFQQGEDVAERISFGAGILPNEWWVIPFATLGFASWYWMITGVLSYFQ